MTKKYPTIKISVNLPAHWVKMMRQDAKRQCTNITELLKGWIKDKCLRSDAV